MSDANLHHTPLDALHIELGGRMVPFAGYSMPVQYEGIMAEHNHTREAAGLFDVSLSLDGLVQAPIAITIEELAADAGI